MDISTFAQNYRLSVKRDNSDGTYIIQGRNECNLYELDDDLLGVMVMLGAEDGRSWAAYHRAFEKAGMQILQNGDAEGSAAFDPQNPIQSRLAIKACGARRLRKLSPERKAKLLQTRKPFSARSDHQILPAVDVAKEGGIDSRSAR
jgi:hypothetical protein